MLHGKAVLSSVYVRRHQFAHRFQSVRLARCLIASQPQDPGKAERVTTLVSLRLLNPVKRYLDYDLWFDDMNPAMTELLDSVIIEPLGHLGQFDVS